MTTYIHSSAISNLYGTLSEIEENEIPKYIEQQPPSTLINILGAVFTSIDIEKYRQIALLSLEKLNEVSAGIRMNFELLRRTQDIFQRYLENEKVHADTNLIDTLLKKGLVNNSLLRASEFNRPKIVELHLQNGASIHQTEQLEGFTPLHAAVRKGHKSMVELLLRHKANLHQVDSFQNTPLHIAVEAGHKEIVEVLINYGADVNHTIHGNALLHIAAAYGHRDVVEVLLQHGANLHQPNRNGSTPLLCASESGSREIIELLLQYGANPHDSNDDGCSALNVASMRGHKECVEFFLSQSALGEFKC